MKKRITHSNGRKMDVFSVIPKCLIHFLKKLQFLLLD